MRFTLVKTIEIVDTGSNMKLTNINSKPHEGKIIKDIIDRTIGVRLYPLHGSEHQKLLHLDRLYGPTQIQVHSHNKPDKTNEV